MAPDCSALPNHPPLSRFLLIISRSWPAAVYAPCVLLINFQVDLVVNMEIPSHGKDYIHRVGRTARAGRAGRSIAFVTQV